MQKVFTVNLVCEWVLFHKHPCHTILTAVYYRRESHALILQFTSARAVNTCTWFLLMLNAGRRKARANNEKLNEVRPERA